MLVTVACLLSGLMLAVQPSAAAPRPAEGPLVPDRPERGGAQILDGEVMSADQIGDALVVGGSFTQIQLADGSLVEQRFLAAFDIDSGALLGSFRPQLDDIVMAVEGVDDGDVVVGGKFTTINAEPRVRLAKLSIATGLAQPDWSPQANGAVTTIDHTGDRLFVGGNFTRLRAKTRMHLAEISVKTGRIGDDFRTGVIGKRDYGYRGDGYFAQLSGGLVRSLRVTPDSTRLLVVHRGNLVGGEPRWGAAFIDIVSRPTKVTEWRSRLWDAPSFENRRDFVGVIDGELSPDGETVVLTTGVGNFPPRHDTVIALPAAGGEDVQPLWVTQMFDSTYGVAISDHAVYVGGHFCWTESSLSQDVAMYWPGPSSNDYGCGKQTAAEFQPETIYRYHLAALDPTTGQALDWNPGSTDSFNGVQFLHVIERGLLVAHDGTRFNDIKVGRLGLFDLAAG